MPRESLSQIRARLRKKLEDRRAANALPLSSNKDIGPPPSYAPPPPALNIGPPPSYAPPPPPISPKAATTAAETKTRRQSPAFEQPSVPEFTWKGVGADGYDSAMSDLKRRLLKTPPASGDQKLRSACDEWMKNQYSPAHYGAVIEALKSNPGGLADGVKSILTDSSGKPKLRSEGGCWTWNLNDQQHRMAVDAFKEATMMAANTANLLTNADPSIKPNVDQLFGQYFGQAPKIGKDAPGSEVATPQSLARNLSVTMAGMQAGNFILCGPSSTTMFDGDTTTAAVADPDKKNVTYLADRFFRPEQRNDPTTPAALRNYEQMLIGAQTILHEASHQFANTKDVMVDGKEKCYGRSDCKHLPGNYAAANADSLAMLAMDLTALSKFGGQMDNKQKEALVNAGAAKPQSTAATSTGGDSSGD
jgi:hypothetical protein